MMITTSQTLTAQQGATFGLSFRMLQADRKTPMDLTGFSARMAVRKDGYADQGGDVVLNLTGSVDEETSIISFSASADVMAGIAPSRDDLRILGAEANTWSKYAYDVEAIATDGTIYKPFRGIFEVYPEVTR